MAIRKIVLHWRMARVKRMLDSGGHAWGKRGSRNGMSPFGRLILNAQPARGASTEITEGKDTVRRAYAGIPAVVQM